MARLTKQDMQPKDNPADKLPEQHLEVMSVEHVDPVAAAAAANMTPEQMMVEIARLRGQVAEQAAGRTEAEQKLADSMGASGFLANVQQQEVPTGKSVSVKRANGYKTVGYHDDGRDIIKPTWGEVRLPTFMYRIDLPPCGGTDMKINGEAMYHGAVVKVDLDTLRTLKDMIARIWAHDAVINGRNENAFAYRKSGEKQFDYSARV